MDILDISTNISTFYMVMPFDIKLSVAEVHGCTWPRFSLQPKLRYWEINSYINEF